MCLMRRDMRSVQERLLSQMVSRHDRFDLSAFDQNTFLLSLSTPADVIRSYGAVVIQCLSVLLPPCSTRVRSRR